MSLYKNKYRSETIRLRNWDYGAPGYYYVTVCTRDKSRFFGSVVSCEDIAAIDASIIMGRYLHAMPFRNGTWEGIAGTHNYASLQPTPPATAVRPPGTVQSGALVQLTAIGEIALQNWLDIPSHFPFVELDEFVIMPDHLHGILYFNKPTYRQWVRNRFGPQSQNLASVIRNYKSATKAYATSHQIEFGWQARFRDEVITSGKELNRIRTYILNNPARWLEAQQ